MSEASAIRATRMRLAAQGAGGVTAAIAAVVLIGWTFDVPSLRALVPGESQMKVNPAIGLTCAGLALVLITRPRFVRAGRVLAGVPLCLGLLTVLEYATATSFGIDTLLASDADAVFTAHAGRMALPTAICLSVCGGCLVAGGGGCSRVASWLALATAAVALVGVVGYAAGLPASLAVGGVTRMPLPTALALLTLALGIASSLPHGALRVLIGDDAGSAAARRLLPVAIGVPPLLGYVSWQGQAAGWYDTHVGILLLVSGVVGAGTVVTVWVARLLNQADAGRRAVDVERQLQAQITSEMGEGVCVVRWSDSTIVYVNARFEEMIGAGPGSLSGRSSSAIDVVTDDRDGLVHAAREEIAAGRHWEGEMQFVRVDGSRFWAATTLSGFEHPDHGALTVSVMTDVTERRAVAIALAQQAELFDSVLRAAAEHSIIGTDLDGTIRVFNAGAEKMLGYTGSELVAQSTPAILHDQDEVVLRAAELGIEPGFDVLVDAARRGETETREWTYVRKDGRRLLVSLTVTGMRDEHGELCGFIGIAQDISARKAAENRVLEERRLLTESQAVGRVGSWEWDLETGAPRWSDEQFRLHGLASADGVPPLERYLGLVHPDDRDALRQSIAANVDRTAEFTDEYRVLLPDASVRTLFVHGDYLPPEVGRPARLAGTTRDVTEERAARAAQQAAEEQFRRSFEDAQVGMTVIGLGGRYERVNDAFCAIVGHPREALVGLHREAITHPDDVGPDAGALESLVCGDAVSSVCEKRYLHASGHLVWVSIGVTLVRDADGAPLRFISHVQDITEQRRYEGELQHMADHDPLTGLLNRRSFHRELDSHVARVDRFGAAGVVLMLDLDNFKYFNDTHGHNAGDQLIVRIAHALSERLRETDVLARLGGDEFAVLLPRETATSAEVVARNLLAVVHDEAAPAAVGQDRRVTASIGIAPFLGGSATGEEMMVNADLAMYDAKEDGRNRFAHYRTEQYERPRIESRMKWATQITDALEHDRFELLAQPIVPLSTHGAAQYELLLRMRGPGGDLIPPGSFLYVAERLGMIQEIDRWVTTRAIDLLAELRAAGHDLRFEVNLSGHTIGDPRLLDVVQDRLRATGVPADRLIFEVTETAAVAQIGRAAAFAEQLSSLGCKFALDDFGAGFGSFYYLKHLPFDYLKIDGEFVRHCAQNATDRVLIAAVVQIARGLGKQTIAEFVSGDDGLEVLRDLGVDYGQGYHLGRPAPLPDLVRALGTAATLSGTSILRG